MFFSINKLCLFFNDQTNVIHFYPYSLNNIFNPVVEQLTTDYNKPKHTHLLDPKNQICSLVTTDKFLVVGTVNEISGWDWKVILNSKLTKPSWTIKVQSQSLIEKCDINCMWFKEEEGKLYAGCGDSKVYAYNLEDGRLVSTYEGHSDFIHCIHSQ